MKVNIINDSIDEEYAYDYSTITPESYHNGIESHQISVTPPRGFIPIVKLTEEMSWHPEEVIPSASMAIKTIDLINYSCSTMRPCYAEIENCGGIHEYLNYFDGPIYLSSIIPDSMLLNMSPEQYSEIVSTVKPDYYFTPDSETYSNEVQLSRLEIDRTLLETHDLLKDISHSKPVALVKGANTEQVAYHAQELKKLGLTTGVFHAGDFLWRNKRLKRHEQRNAVDYANVIRKYFPNFLIYGPGSRKTFRMFEFADGFLVQNHIVSSFYGYKHGKRTHFSGMINCVTRERIMDELQYIYGQYSCVMKDKSRQIPLDLSRSIIKRPEYSFETVVA